MLNDILLDEQILTQHFACDLKKCKGACCTMEGGAGAPVRDNEVDLIESSALNALPYLSERSRLEIQKFGWMDEEADGEKTVRCVDEKDCVFVFYDGDVAKCALERAFFDGKTSFRKPISCHLFPVRIADFGGEYLYYEKIEECSPALVHGKNLDVKIVDTVSEALEREFGMDWVEAAKLIDREQ